MMVGEESSSGSTGDGKVPCSVCGERVPSYYIERPGICADCVSNGLVPEGYESKEGYTVEKGLWRATCQPRTDEPRLDDARPRRFRFHDFESGSSPRFADGDGRSGKEVEFIRRMMEVGLREQATFGDPNYIRLATELLKLKPTAGGRVDSRAAKRALGQLREEFGWFDLALDYYSPDRADPDTARRLIILLSFFRHGGLIEAVAGEFSIGERAAYALIERLEKDERLYNVKRLLSLTRAERRKWMGGRWTITPDISDDPRHEKKRGWTRKLKGRAQGDV